MAPRVFFVCKSEHAVYKNSISILVFFLVSYIASEDVGGGDL